MHIPIYTYTYMCVCVLVHTHILSGLYAVYLQVQVTLSMDIETLVDVTIVPNSHIEPMSTCLDFIILNSTEENIEAFLDKFKQVINNEHEASHFYNFVGRSTPIHRFSIPSESVLLLEHL